MTDAVGPELRTLTHRAPFGREGAVLCGPRDFHLHVYPVVLVFVQHLDPQFQPPDTLVREESYFHPASGCGGGREVLVQRGNATQWITWDEVISEHAADESSVGDWTAYGMAGGCALRLGRYERTSGEYRLDVTGPVPQVDEVMAAWLALLAMGTGVTAEHAREALARAVAQRQA